MSSGDEIKMDKRMIIGKVSGVHGIKGELKIKPLTDDVNRFFDLKKITLLNPKKENEFQITNCRLHKSGVLLMLKGVEDRETAQMLMGMSLSIDRSQAVALNEDEYFIEDLKGLAVYNNSILLGKIVDVQQAGEIDIYMIESAHKTYCLPARKAYIKKIDLQNARIEAIIPPEILEL